MPGAGRVNEGEPSGTKTEPPDPLPKSLPLWLLKRPSGGPGSIKKLLLSVCSALFVRIDLGMPFF